MADEPTPITKTTQTPNQDSSTSAPDGTGSARRSHRPVYEPSLLPTRKRRRASPWVVIPGLLLFLIAILVVLFVIPRQRRFVPTTGQIVFTSDQGSPGHSHIWISGPDGTGAHRLTSSEAEETSATWSRDGSQIAFLASGEGSEPQIFVADADGQNLRQVTRNAGAKSQPQFAPSDSNLLGYTAGGALSTADVPTGQTVRLLPTGTETGRAQSTDATGAASEPPTMTAFSWSPTRDRASQGLAAVEESGGIQALVLLPTLTDKPRDARDNGGPLAAADTLTLNWSPDGALLAVALVGVPGLPTGQHLSAMLLFDAQGNSAGQHPLAIYRGPGIGPEHPVFSSDGTQVVWETWVGADLAHQHSAGLFAAPVDGSAPPRSIYSKTAEDVHFSQDGRTLYFLQTRPDTGHDLCRIGLDGGDFTRLSDGRSDITSVAVSPQASKP